MIDPAVEAVAAKLMRAVNAPESVIYEVAEAAVHAAHAQLLPALKASAGFLRNAKIDLETGATKATAIRTIEGGLRIVEAAIDAAGDAS